MWQTAVVESEPKTSCSTPSHSATSSSSHTTSHANSNSHACSLSASSHCVSHLSGQVDPWYLDGQAALSHRNQLPSMLLPHLLAAAEADLSGACHLLAADECLHSVSSNSHTGHSLKSALCFPSIHVAHLISHSDELASVYLHLWTPPLLGVVIGYFLVSRPCIVRPLGWILTRSSDKCSQELLVGLLTRDPPSSASHLPVVLDLQ